MIGLNLLVVVHGAAAAGRHPSEDELRLALAGAPPAGDGVIGHAAGCELCRKRLEALVGRLVGGGG